MSDAKWSCQRCGKSADGESPACFCRECELLLRLNAAERCLADIRALIPKEHAGIELVWCVLNLKQKAAEAAELPQQYALGVMLLRRFVVATANVVNSARPLGKSGKQVAVLRDPLDELYKLAKGLNDAEIKAQEAKP